MNYFIRQLLRKRVKYDFQKFKTIISFGREIYNSVITLNDAFEEQINLKNEIDNFNEYTKLKKTKQKRRKSTNS